MAIHTFTLNKMAIGSGYTTLHLVYILLKYSLLLTLIRLLSTAFGIEFGVSRQYLRLLELIFHSGQKRIEKVESRARFHISSFENRLENDPSQFGAESTSTIVEAKHTKLANNERRSSSTPNFQPIESNHIKPSQNGHTSNGYVAAKMRRVSTPDGPPIFLLDDDDDDEHDNYVNGDKCEYLNQVNPIGSPTTTHNDCSKLEFLFDNVNKLVVKGMGAIMDDQVTKRFSREELKTWNFMTRSNAKNYQFMSRFLGLFWLTGCVFRYLFLFPLRIVFTLAGFIWFVVSMSLVGFLPKKFQIRDWCYCLLSLMSFRMLSCGISSRLKFHNRQYRAQRGDVCVANHTSPLDALLLACDNCYAIVGQQHDGLLGILQRALSRAATQVWFDRTEMRDRLLVSRRLKMHVNNKANLPVLIFPEGTCINNSAVMLFRKGAFEISDRVCPVAIKYDARFGDPFWNSSKQSYLQYLLLMMSSWAIKCDVWYLPPMTRLADESSAEFANRVKAQIARKGGLVDLAWDGQLKRQTAKEIWRHQQQEDFANRLKV